jgi:hypothetical protein
MTDSDEEYINYYIINRDEVLNEYLEMNNEIFEDKHVIQYLYDYHSKKKFSFFIGLSEEELQEIDKPISYQEYIMCEDWRMLNHGSNYYKITRKLFKDYITTRDILEQLKDNTECLKLLEDKDNDNIVLVMINKKINNDIHFELHFDNVLN